MTSSTGKEAARLCPSQKALNSLRNAGTVPKKGRKEKETSLLE